MADCARFAGVRGAGMMREGLAARWRYAVAIAGVVLAVGVRLALAPVLGPHYPFAAIVLAVLLAAWSCGAGPAWVALGMGGVAAVFLFLPPGWSFDVPDIAHLVGLAWYVAVGGVGILVIEAERRSRHAMEGLMAERGRAEAVVAEWRDRYEGVIRATGHIVYDSDKRTGQVVVAGDTRGVLGLTPEDLTGDVALWLDRIHPDDRPRFDAEFRANLAEGRPFRLEYRVRRADGSWATVHDEGYPVLDDRGTLARTVGLVKDVTERRLIEEALRESERRFGLAVEHLPHGFVLYDADRRFVYMNPKGQQICGRSLDELSGRRDEEVWPEAITRHYLPALRRAAEARTVESFEWILPPEMGGPTLQIIYVPLVGERGELRQIIALVYDVTGLRRAEERLRLAVEATGLGIWDSSPTLDMIVWNDELRSIYGLPHGKPITLGSICRRIHRDDLAAVEAAHVAAIDPQGDGRFEVEHRIVRDDGATRWVSVSGRCLDDVDRETGARTPTRMVGTALDVTDRKDADARLRRSEERLRRIHDQTAVGIVTCDLDGRLIAANPGFCQLLGYTPEEIPGLTVGGITHPDDLEADLAQACRSVAGEIDRYTLEKRYIRKDGSPVWVQLTSSTLRDERGLPQAGLAIVQDISERRAAEDELRRSEERFRLTTEAVNGLLYEANPRTRAVWRSNALKGLLGYAPEEAEPTFAWWHDRIHPDDLAALKASQPDRREVFEGQYRVRHRDGHYVWVWEQGRIEFGPDGQPSRLFGFTVDVTTQHRQAEELAAAYRRLEESLALLDTLLTTAPVGLCFVDTAYRFVRINDTLAALNGRPAADHLGRSIAELLPEVWPLIEPLLRRVAATGEPIADLEVRAAMPGRGDGATGVWLASYYPVRVGDDLLGFGIVAQDVTDRKQTEEALRDGDRRKDEFLAMLAHELRNPLAPIRNALAVMTMTADDAETQRWSREVIDRQLRHLTSLVDDLLDVSRITQGKITLTRAPLPIASVVQAAVEASRPLIDARRHTLQVDLPGDGPEPLRVEGDATRLAQVVLNLLNNAAKYTPEGGHIRLSVAREAGMAAIRVRDDGDGIPADMLPRVFELFTQVDRSIDRSQGGLGIGLTLVKRLVEMHGGTIEARSDGPGTGSEFVVRLPLTAAHPPHAPADRRPAASPAQGQGHGRRILIVDDSRDSTETLARLLRRLGHDVATADDGLAACEAALHMTPDLVLLDIGLPVMDGYEVARRLRAEPSLDGTYLVALTGYGSESDRRKSAEAGFDDHLVKPVEFDALMAVLERTQVGNL